MCYLPPGGCLKYRSNNVRIALLFIIRCISFVFISYLIQGGVAMAEIDLWFVGWVLAPQYYFFRWHHNSKMSVSITGIFWLHFLDIGSHSVHFYIQSLHKSHGVRCKFFFYDSTNIVQSLTHHGNKNSVVKPRALIKPPQLLLSFPWTPVDSLGHAASLSRPWTLNWEGPAGLGE